MNIIEVNRLTKSYGKARGIEDVNFDVKEGEIFGLIGPNGAGKSTIIRILLSLIHPTRGSVKIFGKDCTKHASEIMQQVGYLPSQLSYYDHMKVIDLLKYADSFYPKDCKGRIRELASLLHLDLNKKIKDLSSGNKKKVGIIQGLLHSPKLIILDEPTSGLDPNMQKKIFDLIKEENRQGATVLISSHSINEVQQLCDRVAVMKDGRIVNVEMISEFREHAYKKISLETVDTIDRNHFKMSGISSILLKDKSAQFLYSGNLNTIMNKISELNLRNIKIEEPVLEEIFLHY